LTDGTGPRRRSSEEAAVSSAVARHVRALRQDRNWSLDELAGRSGVSRGMVVQIEGARTNPSIGTLCRLAEAFGVNLAALIESREILHVQRGELVVTVDGIDHRVAAGETVEFAADRPHGHRNDGSERAVLMMVVVTPAAERDRRRPD
jgi:transcriptional regulator with XRE-family HTH domain